MDPKLIQVIIIALVSVSYLFDQWLEYLNLRHTKPDVPPEMRGYYDAEKYARSMDYLRVRARFGFWSSAFGFFLMFTMLVSGGFGWLDGVLRNVLEGQIPLALAFFGLLMLAFDILTLPFQWYSTFVIEARFGFNTTTVKTFVGDKIKGYLLGAVVGGGMLALLILLIQSIGPDFWIWFGIAAAVFMLLVNVFYTAVIVPLFNKLTPLPDGALKDAIERFADQVKFPLNNIYVIDGSKRSKKANAFFSGLGRRKKVVLYDTLIQNHSHEELVAVLAHEVGHFKKRHIVWSYVLSVVQIFFMLWILSLMLWNENLSLALGGGQWAIHLNLLAFAVLYSPVSAVSGLLMNIYSRRNEYEADAFARQTYDGAALATALKKLSVDSLSNLFPHPLYVFFHYSHPPLLRRLRAIEHP